MSVLVVDGMGGGLGAQIVAQLRRHMLEVEIMAVGTNSIATSNMVKAGANRGATGENAVKVCLRNAKCVVGPWGIILADAMLGEITPHIAVSICSSPVPKVLIPVNHKNIEIVGMHSQQTMSVLLKMAVTRVEEIMK